MFETILVRRNTFDHLRIKEHVNRAGVCVGGRCHGNLTKLHIKVVILAGQIYFTGV